MTLRRGLQAAPQRDARCGIAAPVKASLDVRLARSGSLTITNIDPMVHKIIQEIASRVGMRTVSHDHLKMVGMDGNP